MNFLILVFVAAPLSVYLLWLLYALREIEPSEPIALEDADAPDEIWQIEIAPPLSADVLAPDSAIAEPLPEGVTTVDAFAPEAVSEASPDNAMTADAPARVATDDTASELEPEPIPTVPPPSELSALDTDETIITPPASDLQPEDSEHDPAGLELAETDGKVHLPANGSPRFTFDYRGRLWIEKKRKGFFRQLRRPQMPPDEPG